MWTCRKSSWKSERKETFLHFFLFCCVLQFYKRHTRTGQSLKIYFACAVGFNVSLKLLCLVHIYSVDIAKTYHQDQPYQLYWPVCTSQRGISLVYSKSVSTSEARQIRQEFRNLSLCGRLNLESLSVFRSCNIAEVNELQCSVRGRAVTAQGSAWREKPDISQASLSLTSYSWVKSLCQHHCSPFPIFFFKYY